MNILLRVLVALALTAAARAAEVKHVFIVSLDQAKPENLEAAAMPTLKGLVREGAHTWEAFTVVPSLTLLSHVSMLTGVGVQKHQILWNEFQPQNGLLQVPTIFKLAKEQGLTTVLVAAKSKFKTLHQPRSLDAFVLPASPKAAAIGEAAAAEIVRLKPNLCFIHFGDPDVYGHQYGVDSPEKLQALAECDAALGVILGAIQDAGLASSSVVLITADHGGHDIPQEESEKRKALGQPPQPGTHGTPARSDVVIPWIAWGTGVKKDFTITAPVVTYDTAATALWLLGVPIPEHFWGRPVKSAFEGGAP